MIEFRLLRHGATTGNLEKRYIGRTDEALATVGIAQLELLRGKLPQPDWIFCSPLQRAKQSVELLFPNHSYVLIDAFRETDFGCFEGKTAKEMETDPRYRAWVDSKCMAPIPGGESAEDMTRRILSAFFKAMEHVLDGETVLFVLHGGGIMAILSALARPKQDFYSYHIANGGYYLCEWMDEQWIRILSQWP